MWFRVTGRLPEDEAVHAAALTFVSDLTLLSAGLARTGGGWGGSTVGASLDHAVWFHRPARADEWFLYETDSPAAASGRALCFGQIWAAGHANLFHWRAFAANPAARDTSQVFRITLLNGAPEQAEQVYGNDGSQIAAASIAVSSEKDLLIGSSLDDKLLSCKAK